VSQRNIGEVSHTRAIRYPTARHGPNGIVDFQVIFLDNTAIPTGIVAKQTQNHAKTSFSTPNAAVGMVNADASLISPPPNPPLEIAAIANSNKKTSKVQLTDLRYISQSEPAIAMECIVPITAISELIELGIRLVRISYQETTDKMKKYIQNIHLFNCEKNALTQSG
jgi:hypothetical protein